jgi:YfiH family protein
MPPESSTASDDWLVPGWQAPGVGALMSTRRGGHSAGAFDSLNLRHGLGDEPRAVDANLRQLHDAIGAAPVWLQQVHGCKVVRLTGSDLRTGAPPHEADASFTTEPGVVCAVQVADCLPVLFAAPGGRGVAAAHAGWRGLSLGVIEATLESLCDASACDAAQVQVWLGACIGPRRFEVGPDVLRAFGAHPEQDGAPHFRAHAPGKWMADLCGLARERLHAAGVTAVTGGVWCTVEEPSRFFSYRRDRVTGRMAAAVWLRGPG